MKRAGFVWMQRQLTSLGDPLLRVCAQKLAHERNKRVRPTGTMPGAVLEDMDALREGNRDALASGTRDPPTNRDRKGPGPVTGNQNKLV